MKRSCYRHSSSCWRYALLLWLCALGVAVVQVHAQLHPISFDMLLVRAADSSGSSSAGGSDALDDTVTAPDDDTALYDSLVTATLSGKPWTDVKIQKFSVNTLSQALADVVIHLTTRDMKATLLKKYTSLGRQLPERLDLTGLRFANAAIQENEWTQALNNTQSILAETSTDNTDAPLLWTCATSLHKIQTLEENATKFANLKEHQKYFENVRAYFQASTWLAWSVEELSVLEQIDATEVVGKFAILNSTDEWWFTPFISTELEDGDSIPSFRDDASVLTELALLKHVPGTVVTNVAEAELLGAIASKYLGSAADAIRKSDLKALQAVFQGDEGQDLEEYATVAQKFCTPAHSSIRFCLLSQLADQGHEFATIHRSLLGSSSTVTKLPLEATNLNRQQYLETVQNRVTAQTLSLAIVTAFNSLSVAVQEASTSVISRSQSSSFTRVEEQQRAIELQLGQQAGSMLSAASNDKATNEQQLSALLQSISESNSKVDKLFDPYVERLRVIANAAHGAAAAKSVKGFFGLFKKILRALSPVTWITNPGSLVDVFSAANDFRKDVSGLKGVKKLIRLLQDGLIPQMNQLTDQMTALYPKLLLIRDALNLIVPPGEVDGVVGKLTISKNDLSAHSSNFLKVYGDYNNPVLVTDVDVLETLFVNLQSSFCQVGGKKVPQECAQVQTDVQLFGKLREGVAASLDAMDSLVATARAVVAEQSAKILSATLVQVSNETSASLSALKAKWDSENAQNALEFELYQRQLRYGEAVNSLALMKASIQSAEAALTACNFFTYLNGGVPIKPCNAVYASPASGSAALDVKQLIAFKFNNKPDVIQRIAYIPTSPSSAGDLHYINLERMLTKSASSPSSSSANVTFRVPKDEKWLRKYNWVPADFDLNSTVAFVTKFQILFPSKQLSSSTLPGSNSNKRMVSVVTQASATSDLGPAVNNKVYEIPRRSFTFRYQEMNSAAIGSCELKLTNLYQKCDSRLSNYCALSTGEVDTDDDTPLPSVFSTFSIQASFSLAAVSSAIKTLSFTGVEVSAPLVIALEMQLYSVNSDSSTKPTDAATAASDTGSADGSSAEEAADNAESGSESSSRRLRRQASSSSSAAGSGPEKRCCAVDSYLTDWESKSCAECPEGHISQLGGLYCVPAPSSA